MKCVGLIAPLDAVAVKIPIPNTAATKYTNNGMVRLQYAD